MWLWNLESSNDFTIRSAYKVMAHHHHIVTKISTKVLWHKDIPFEGRSFRLTAVLWQVAN